MMIGFVGNMNNNNFALMRYFRDLGADAHLLLLSDDGTGANSHFRPECDSWDIGRWSPFIHRLGFGNTLHAMVGDPARLRLPPSRAELRAAFEPYGALVGSGITPMILGRCGRALDIFYPYSTGIEFVGCRVDQNLFNSGNLLRRLLCRRLRGLQIEGIRRARHCVNLEMGLTRETFKAIGKGFVAMATPLLYNGENASAVPLSPAIQGFAERIRRHPFRCFSHASQTWRYDPAKYSAGDWSRQSKNNHWLIRGFAEFSRSAAGRDALLVLVEYGLDVEASKRLVAELGLEANVLWLPRMARKELLRLLSFCDVGVGEFTVDPGCIWGGTGWEVLAAGKPLLQSFNFTTEEFAGQFGYPPPPLLDAKSAEDVVNRLADLAGEPGTAERIGAESRRWFDRHNGAGLARKWLELISGQSPAAAWQPPGRELMAA